MTGIPRSQLPDSFLVPMSEREYPGGAEQWAQEDLATSAKKVFSVKETEFVRGTKVDPSWSSAKLLEVFQEREREIIKAIPAASNLEDLRMFYR